MICRFSEKWKHGVLCSKTIEYFKMVTVEKLTQRWPCAAAQMPAREAALRLPLLHPTGQQ